MRCRAYSLCSLVTVAADSTVALATCSDVTDASTPTVSASAADVAAAG